MEAQRKKKNREDEWVFFRDGNGRIRYNNTCTHCGNKCKQSFRAVLIQCSHYYDRQRPKRWGDR